ncbi:MAG TPA: nucleotide disphospho-sugar-binding domain-containing protein [Terriglobales bacterium]|nr:nucleotide disphospho-sugar-binding domain-containing protein [Terriglobales bacterium]
MRIAFATLRFPSHLNSMTSLARKVREHGHEVFFVGVPDSESFVRAAGIEFYSVAEREFPVGSWLERDAQLAKLSGAAGLRFTIQGLCSVFDAIVRDCPDVFRRARAQAAVLDQLATGYTAVAKQMGLPIIHVAIALAGNPWDCAPPAAFGWPYRAGWISRLRNRTGHAILRYLVRTYTARVADYYRQHGVAFDFGGLAFGCSKLAQIAQTPAAFEFPNPELPPWFHHTGPFDDGGGRAEVQFPWERLTGEPLIYASMGTLQNGFEHVFRTIAEACSGLGCQLVLSIGTKLTMHDIGPLPGNCIAVNYAPQRELLRRATLCITHAGLTTALESLAAGVPMLAIPVTNDQPGVAARIAYTRTGTVVPIRRLNALRLRRAIRQVLEDGKYRENARRMQAEIQAANGLERAAHIIDQCLDVRSQLHSDAASHLPMTDSAKREQVDQRPELIGSPHIGKTQVLQ